MRKTISLAAALLVAAPLAGSVRADDATGASGKSSAPHAQHQGAGMPAGAPVRGGFEADDIIGSKVQDSGGQDLGSVDDLIVSPSEGKIDGAILTLGGVFGVGGRKVQVPWSSLAVAPKPGDPGELVVTASRDALEKAPAYDGERAASAGGASGSGAASGASRSAQMGDRDRADD